MEREHTGNEHDDGTDEQTHMAAGTRRALGVFALLVTLIVVAAICGVALARHARPPAGAPPLAASPATTATSESVAATPSPTITPPRAETLIPTATATATAQPVLTATAMPAQAPTATPVLPIGPATPPPGATVRGSTIVVVPASPTAQRVAVVEPIDPRSPLVPEIVTAYLHYWDVRTQAFRSLDPTRLPDVLADPALSQDRDRIAQLRNLRQAVQLQGEHSISIAQLASDTALLVDQFANRSVAIDPATGREIPGLAPALQKLVYTLRKIDGVWKVVEVQQQ